MFSNLVYFNILVKIDLVEEILGVLLAKNCHHIGNPGIFIVNL
jgi:hypothetical protein